MSSSSAIRGLTRYAETAQQRVVDAAILPDRERSSFDVVLMAGASPLETDGDVPGPEHVRIVLRHTRLGEAGRNWGHKLKTRWKTMTSLRIRRSSKTSSSMPFIPALIEQLPPERDASEANTIDEETNGFYMQYPPSVSPHPRERSLRPRCSSWPTSSVSSYGRALAYRPDGLRCRSKTFFI